jgi:hypothetical protein
VVQVGQLGVGRSAPAVEHLVERARLPFDGCSVQHVREPVGVDGDGGGVESIPDRGRLHDLGQRPPQPEEVRLESGDGVPRRSVGPEGVDGHVGGHGVAPVQHQQREQPLLERTVGRDVPAGGVADADRTEHLDLERAAAGHGATLRSATVVGTSTSTPDAAG